jgi:hypothetical protein
MFDVVVGCCVRFELVNPRKRETGDLWKNERRREETRRQIINNIRSQITDHLNTSPISKKMSGLCSCRRVLSFALPTMAKTLLMLDTRPS